MVWQAIAVNVTTGRKNECSFPEVSYENNGRAAREDQSLVCGKLYESWKTIHHAEKLVEGL